ncbi:MAG: hypothetical protein EHM58_06855 [Ignavibacteriae bacterium]|nr:MAG: hypothetical protein EHM58_06855 [Ignavibacteriota bacterium]
MKVKLINIALLFCLLQSANISIAQQNNSKLKFKLNQKAGGDGTALLTIHAVAIAIIINPVVMYENKKFYFGLTREVSLGFGKHGEFRISGEYTYIFRTNLKHHLRASVKYDMMSSLSRSEWLPSRDVFTIGAGYFLDEEGPGIFPEITAGYRLGEPDYILYPYIKLRHTFMTKKDKPDNTDFSLGMILGFKPF